MKLRRIVFAVLFLSLFVHAVDETPVHLIINSSGILTGARCINVGGVLYDVDFRDGTCVEVFNGCDEASDFLAATGGTRPFSQALLDQVLLDSPAGLFDTH